MRCRCQLKRKEKNFVLTRRAFLFCTYINKNKTKKKWTKKETQSNWKMSERQRAMPSVPTSQWHHYCVYNKIEALKIRTHRNSNIEFDDPFVCALSIRVNCIHWTRGAECVCGALWLIGEMGSSFANKWVLDLLSGSDCWKNWKTNNPGFD